MPIAVWVERQVEAGQEQALLAHDLRIQQQPYFQGGRLRAAHFFQSAVDPRHFGYLGLWARRADYWEYLRAAEADAAFAVLGSCTARRHFLERVSVYERVGQRAAVITAKVIHCPAAARESVSAFLGAQARQDLRDQPGVVWRALYRDADDGDWFVAVRGFASAAAQEAVRAAVGPTIDRWLQDQGVAVYRFQALTRATVAPSREQARPREGVGAAC